MSSPRSPYREAGLNPWARPGKKKSPKPVVSAAPGLVKWRHEFFDYLLKTKFALCRRCHQPRFVVDGKKCAGRTFPTRRSSGNRTHRLP